MVQYFLEVNDKFYSVWINFLTLTWKKNIQQFILHGLILSAQTNIKKILILILRLTLYIEKKTYILKENEKQFSEY